MYSYLHSFYEIFRNYKNFLGFNLEIDVSYGKKRRVNLELEVFYIKKIYFNLEIEVSYEIFFVGFFLF